MEIISTYYFDLYPIEQEDVIENFKNRIDKITSKLELKYDIHFEDETNLNMGASKMMGGGDADSTYPYSMFENIFNYISNAKAKVIESREISASKQTHVENNSAVKPIDSSAISEPRPNSSNEYIAAPNAPLSKPIEKVEQIQSPIFKNTKTTPTSVTEFPPQKHTEPLIEEKKRPYSHNESETDFESEIDDDSDNESIIDEMTKEIIRVQLNVYNVKEKGLELMMKIRKIM